MRAAAAILLTVALLLPGTVQAADKLAMQPVAAEYEVYVGGVHLLRAETRADLTTKTYRMAAKAQTVGIWDDWFPWEMSVESVGKNADGAMQPKHYKTISSWKHKPQLLIMDYKNDGGVTYAKESTDAPDPKDRLSDDIVNKTLDPLSGLLQLMAHYTMHDDCNATTAVFDGKRRFDLTTKDLGEVTLQPNEVNLYSGTARKCALRFNLIAGKPKDMESRKFWQTDKGKTNRPPFIIWMARLRPDLPPMPVMAETSSPFGSVMVHLAAWRIEDKPVAPELYARMEPRLESKAR
ncbi:MAG: DUF3108 domain-containing protein [Alphaproteobacteria bacterium]